MERKRKGRFYTATRRKIRKSARSYRSSGLHPSERVLAVLLIPKVDESVPSAAFPSLARCSPARAGASGRERVKTARASVPDFPAFHRSPNGGSTASYPSRITSQTLPFAPQRHLCPTFRFFPLSRIHPRLFPPLGQSLVDTRSRIIRSSARYVVAAPNLSRITSQTAASPCVATRRFVLVARLITAGRGSHRSRFIDTTPEIRRGDRKYARCNIARAARRGSSSGLQLRALRSRPRAKRLILDRRRLS